MGRQEKPLADPRSPQGALAAFLRALRIEAELTYTDMGTGVPSAVSTLSQAASGDTLPTLDTVRDYVTACRLDEPKLTTALQHAETLWKNAVLHAKGITHPAGRTGLPGDQPHTPRQFAAAVTALLGSRGLFTYRDIENATDKTGHRIPRSTLARLLNRNTNTVMPSTTLNTLLDACGIDNTAQRAAWTTARTNTALVTAGLTTPHLPPSAAEAPHDITDNVHFLQGPMIVRAPVVTGAQALHHVLEGGDSIITPDGTTITLDVKTVTGELEHLCRGHGVYATPPPIGPALLRLITRVSGGVRGSERQRLITLITDASLHLPADLRTTFLTAANIGGPEGPSASQPHARATSLTPRLTALAEVRGVDVRTVRRRLHDAASLLAEQLIADLARRDTLAPSFRRSLLVCCDLRRYVAADDQLQHDLQRLMARSLDRAGAVAGLDRSTWLRQPKGDEEWAVLPPDAPELKVVDQYVRALNAELAEANRYRIPEARARLRLAIHHGTIVDGANGFSGQDSVLVSRLLNSKAAHLALDQSPEANLVVVLSDIVYSTLVLPGHTTLRATDFRRVEIREKTFVGHAWMWIPNGDVHLLDLDDPAPHAAL